MSHVAPGVEQRVAKTASRRLIDDDLACVETSLAGRRERYTRGATSHTVHVWWARRPHSAMRALVFACLARSDGMQATSLLRELTVSVNAEPDVLERARHYLQAGSDRAPRVLDMFAGGGTIPYEALNLGADVWSVDANPLSVFLQRSLLVYPGCLEGFDLAALVQASGRRVLEQLRRQTEPFFPLRATASDEQPVVYLWTYAQRCRHCGYRFLLMKRPWLSRKAGKRSWLRPVDTPSGQQLVIEQGACEPSYSGAWRTRTGPPVCPRCRQTHTRPDALACEDWLAGVVSGVPRQGKRFSCDHLQTRPSPALLLESEQRLLAELHTHLPDTLLPRWSGVVNPPLHGIRRHADIFNPRQRVVALTLIKVLREQHGRLTSEHGEPAARAVTGLLSGLVDQLVDWNCRLSMWISQNEQIGRAFCGPGIAMLWDYAEMDPCLSGPANLWDKLARIESACHGLQALPKTAHVDWGDARNLPYEDGFFDAVVTDPPYYDNLPYAALADCFYAWKRLLLGVVEPELFESAGTAGAGELVASSRGCPADADPHEHYCLQLETAVAEAARVVAPNGVCAFVYSHSSLRGWQAVIRALRRAPLRVTDVQPLAIERRQRPRAMSARAVNTCLVFVARKASEGECSAVQAQSFQALVNGGFVDELLKAGWEDADAALALFARGVAILASGEDGEEDLQRALLEMERMVQMRFPLFRMSRRRPL